MRDQLAFPKGRSRRLERRDKRQARAALIRAVRLQVMQRDLACRVCGSTDRPEMHELVSRALRRGQPPEDVFNLVNCLRLCSRCHRLVTRHDLALVPVTAALGANGRVEAQPTLVSRWRAPAPAASLPDVAVLPLLVETTDEPPSQDR